MAHSLTQAYVPIHRHADVRSAYDIHYYIIIFGENTSVTYYPKEIRTQTAHTHNPHDRERKKNTLMSALMAAEWESISFGITIYIYYKYPTLCARRMHSHEMA